MSAIANSLLQKRLTRKVDAWTMNSWHPCTRVTGARVDSLLLALIGRFSGWFLVWLVLCCLVGSLFGRFFVWLVGWFLPFDCLFGCFAGSLVDA